MKTIISRKLDNGYTILVTYDPDGPLAVCLENSKEEFVGQLFSSFDTVEDSFARLSNYTSTLSDDDMKTIKSQVTSASGDTPKTESKVASFMTKTEFVNRQLSKFLHN